MATKTFVTDKDGATADASSISNREYEERLQDKYRQIKLLDSRYLTDFVDEFNNLISE